MELLGFMDNPGVAGSWSPTAEPDVTAGRHTRSTDLGRLADRAPTEVGTEFLKGNIRWSVLAALILIGAGIAALGAWVTQKPVLDTEAALAGVQSSAAELRPAVAELTSFNEGLAGIEVDTSSVNETLTRVDSLARQLFTASASLPQAEATSRGLATDASGDALDATKLLREAYAYRAALLPVLAAPSLVTDPELIELDEAVRQFGAWQARFDEVRTALPDEFMGKVTVELGSISTQLEVMLSDYVDALRAGDAAAAESVAESLQRRLSSAESILFAALGNVQTRVQRHIDGSLFAIDLLIG
ncbi:MAG: hypothetical protein ACRDVL_12715 [Acidimicrobiia bacterium]